MKRAFLVTTRILAFAILVYVIGEIGGVSVVKDLRAAESMPQRYAQIALIYLLGSVVIGLLVPRRWYLAVLGSWGPFFYCGTVYYYFGRPGLLLQMSDFIVLAMVLIPSLSLISAWAASRFRPQVVQHAT